MKKDSSLVCFRFGFVVSFGFSFIFVFVGLLIGVLLCGGLSLSGCLFCSIFCS